MTHIDQDIAAAATALAHWGSRQSGNLTPADWMHARTALAAISRLEGTLAHLRSGVEREMETERLLTSWAAQAAAGGARS